MTPAEILAAIAPELAANPGMATHLQLAEGQTGDVYGGQRNHAVALLAAHSLTVAGRGGYAGAVTSVKEGQLAMSFAVRADADAMESTSYGQELLRLRRQCVIGARTRLVR